VREDRCHCQISLRSISRDPEQEYFADGVVEDIINKLSRIRWLSVIARNSTITYKRQAVDLKQVARELGVLLCARRVRCARAAIACLSDIFAFTAQTKGLTN
jgi:hypothetical protein